MTLSKKDKDKLLEPIAEGLSKHIFDMGFYNNYILETSIKTVSYITFSNEGYVCGMWNSEKYIKKILEKYSFNIQVTINATNKSGFGQHDEITVIFNKRDLIKHKEQLEIIGNSFSGITKFHL